MSYMHSNTLKWTHAGEPAVIREVRITPIGLPGILHVPSDAYACVAFAHGSGSSRLSPRNLAVAQALNARGIATLLFDLLTPEEESDRNNVFDIYLLAAAQAACRETNRWIAY